MFFHQFIHTSDVGESVTEGKAAIIFLLDPSSEDGLTLLDNSFCSPLGEYGERKNIDLLSNQAGSEEYSKFVASIFKLLSELTDELPKVPAIIIVRRQNGDARVDIFSEYEPKDRQILRKDIYTLMDALSSSEAEEALSLWQRRHQVRRLSVTHGAKVARILEFLKEYLGPFLLFASG